MVVTMTTCYTLQDPLSSSLKAAGWAAQNRLLYKCHQASALCLQIILYRKDFELKLYPGVFQHQQDLLNFRLKQVEFLAEPLSEWVQAANLKVC